MTGYNTARFGVKQR